MTFDAPFLMVEIKSGSNGTKMPLAEFLQDKITDFGIPYNLQGNITAPFITSAQLTLDGSENASNFTFSLEFPMESIHKVRDSISPNDTFYVKFGYLPNFMSKEYSFRADLPEVSVSESDATLNYNCRVFGDISNIAKIYNTNPDKSFSASDSLTKVLDFLFSEAAVAYEINASNGSKTIADNTMPFVSDYVPVRGTSLMNWIKALLRRTNIGLYLEAIADKVIVNLADFNKTNVNSGSVDIVEFVSKQYLPQRIDYSDVSEPVVLPLLGFSLGETIHATSWSSVTDNTVYIDEMGEDVSLISPNSMTKLFTTSLVTSNTNFVSVKKPEKYVNRLTNTITVQSLMWPSIIPYHTIGRMLTPLNDFRDVDLYIRKVTYSLIGDYSMEVEMAYMGLEDVRQQLHNQNLTTGN